MPKNQILSIHLTSQVQQLEQTLQPRQYSIIIIILIDQSWNSFNNIAA